MRFKYKLEVIPTFSDRVCETLTFMVEAKDRAEADALAAQKKSVSQGTHILSFITQEEVFVYEIETLGKGGKVKKTVTHEIAAFSKERADDIIAGKLDRRDTSVYDFLSSKGKKNDRISVGISGEMPQQK